MTGLWRLKNMVHRRLHTLMLHEFKYCSTPSQENEFVIENLWQVVACISCLNPRSIDIESFLTWKFGHISRRHLAVSKEIDLFHFIRSRSCTRVSRGSDYYVNFQISRLIQLWRSLLVFIEAGNISFFQWKLLG